MLSGKHEERGVAKREIYEALLKQLHERRTNGERFVAQLEAAGITGLKFNSTTFDEQEQALNIAIARLP